MIMFPGKIGQCNALRKDMKPVSTQQELDALFWHEDTEVLDFFHISKNIVEVQTATVTGYNKPNKNSSSVIAAYTTSKARITMQKALLACLTKKIIPIYTDTDSYVLKCPKGIELPLNMGNAFYQFKNELPNQKISFFHSIGAKMYQLAYYADNSKGNDKVKVITKLKGFFLKSEHSKNIVHDRLFTNYIDLYLQNEHAQTTVAFWQIKTNRNRQLSPMITEKVLTNSGFSKRVAFKGDNFSYKTLPFGYSLNMYTNVILD